MTRGHMLTPHNSTLNASWRITGKIPKSILAQSALVLVDGKYGVGFEYNANFSAPQYLPRYA
jgi:hypothetical protein